jgi:predicted aconitase with swiveling domain
MTEKKSETLTWVPSRPARGESLTPKVIEMVGGSSSTVGNAVIT